MAIHNNLDELFTGIANAIRAKTGETDAIIADEFPSYIERISVSGGINFSVINGVKPTTAEQNTLWVDTEITISKYMVCIDTPEFPIDGLVWVKVDWETGIIVDINSENPIIIYPSAVYQYANNAWVRREASIYINGAWEDIYPPELILFENGEFAEDIGGVNGGLLTTGEWQSWCGSNYSSNTYYRTNNPVDLSRYTTLHFTVAESSATDGSHRYFGVSPNDTASGDLSVLFLAYSYMPAYGEQSIDISSVKESVYIYNCVNAWSGMGSGYTQACLRVSKIWATVD